MENKEKRKDLHALNPAQLEAVHATGPVLVLAGAGAGKTKTISARIVHLIENGVAPDNILAITFTNKSAAEMKERVRQAIADSEILRRPVHTTEVPFVSTFHSLCVYLLRAHGKHIGVSSHFSIYDRQDSRQAIKEVMTELGIDKTQVDPARILGAMSREKGNLTTPEELAAQSEGDYTKEIVSRVWERYRAHLKKQHALDFDDLLLETVRLFREFPDVRKIYETRWRYLHVDEYQDTNRVQYELVRLLGERHQNIFAVGDIDQTIYTWRGAHIQNLLQFEKEYPNTTVILLEENYRSTGNIIAAANAVIKKNTVRYDKTLYTNNELGEPIGVYAAYDGTDEASFVAGKAAEYIRAGVPPKEIAVLYRANFQSRALEQAFLEEDVPYQVLGTQFFDRREIKDAISFIRAALNTKNLADLKRIINVPPRGIGKLTLLKVMAGKTDTLTAAQKTKVAEFRRLLEKITSVVLREKPSEIIKFVIKETGLTHTLERGTEEDKERLENLQELVTVATAYDSLPVREGVEKFVADVALRSEQDELAENRNAVRLMTVHAAKGLEFDRVFVTGLEQDLFPHQKIHESRSGIGEDEEERRLFYVAITRARKKLMLSYANIRTIYGTRQINLPSEFLSDIEPSLLQIEQRPTQRLGKTIYFD